MEQSRLQLPSRGVIIFDFDGPIVDSFEGAFALSKRISPALTIDLFRERFQHNIHLVPEHLQLPKDESIDFDLEYTKYMATLNLASHKYDALVTLSRYFEFDIVSGSHTDTITEFLNRNKVAHLFRDVLGHDFGKSKVERFNYLFERHQVPASQVNFITDTTGDIMEAKRVSMGTIIAVHDGFHDKQLLLSASPTHCVPSLAHVPDILIPKGTHDVSLLKL